METVANIFRKVNMAYEFKIGDIVQHNSEQPSLTFEVIATNFDENKQQVILLKFGSTVGFDFANAAEFILVNR